MRSAVHRVSANYAAIELSRQAAEASRENLELINDSYDRGAVDLITLLDAQSVALQADLAAADAVGLLPVYAAGEAPLPGGDSGTIAGHLADKGLEGVSLLGGHDNIPDWLDGFVEEGGLVLTLGAGDIGRQVDRICAHLAARSEHGAEGGAG